ncbi:heme-containing dehydratase protein [Apiospora kogelbergensis]|uniref:Heme-containing dehydratase protein n=1 Tax=Apiospora kogelbergensis TaxID=1337665 RepID=A0AAW0R0P7_9PEZI
MYESNGEKPQGFGHCGELIPLTEKTGYWGAYRSRMTQSTPGDTFTSSLSALPKPNPLSGEIRTGRTRITKFPDNICFVVEGQDYSAMPPPERAYWDENFDGLAKQWITNVMTAGPTKGLVSGRACHAFAGKKQLGASSNGTSSRASSTDSASIEATSISHERIADAMSNGGSSGGSSTSSSLFPGLDYIRQAQLLFWLDLSHMEHIGRWDKVHITLRRSFLDAYGPGGVMDGGDLLLWVDLGVLKSNEMDAEYVGCYEGTGFTTYDHDAAFESKKEGDVNASSLLPAFFDRPVESRPMEW